MASADLDVVLHPVRWRVLLALAGGPRTVRDLREVMCDVPQATLYRHLTPLVDAGVVTVVDEQPARGAVERTYALAARDAGVADWDADDHRRAFLFLQAALLAELEGYLDGPNSDPQADGLTYSQATVHLTREDLGAFTAELDALVGRYLRPRKGSGSYGVGITIIPPRA